MKTNDYCQSMFQKVVNVLDSRSGNLTSLKVQPCTLKRSWGRGRSSGFTSCVVCRAEDEIRGLLSMLGKFYHIGSSPTQI